MSLDEQLPDLLAREAEHADVAPPTMDGVQAVIGRRARRRRHQRVAGGVLAGLCLVAGVAGGLALSREDDEPATVVPVGELPAVPPIGIDAPGLTLVSAAEIGGGSAAEAPVSVVVFTRAENSPVGPVIVAHLGGEASFQPSTPDAEPVDLDGDGSTSGEADGRVGTLGQGEYVVWTTAGGNPATVIGYGADRAELVEYVRSLGRSDYSLEEVPAPDGFPDRRLVNRGPQPEAKEFLSIYQSDGLRTVFVRTTNASGGFDQLRVNLVNPVEVPLGSSILGDGVAVLSDSDSPDLTALVRTDTGLTVEITGDGLEADELRDLLADGRFVEVEPTDESPRTTVLDPASTTATTSITPVDAQLQLTDVRQSFDNGSETIELQFDHGIPDYRNLTLLESAPDGCTAATAAEVIFGEGQNEPNWNGWLTIEVDASADPIDPAALPLEGEPYVLCGSGTSPVTIAAPVRNLGEPTVTALSGRPVLLIDIPR